MTKEATCAENGEITYTCSVCGEKWTETIPVTVADMDRSIANFKVGTVSEEIDLSDF